MKTRDEDQHSTANGDHVLNSHVSFSYIIALMLQTSLASWTL